MKKLELGHKFTANADVLIDTRTILSGNSGSGKPKINPEVME